MVRRFDEPIEVRPVRDVEEGLPGLVPGSPSAFLWRGRLYAVSAVQSHWRERRSWWRESRAEDGAAGRDEGGTSADVVTRSADRQVWRVAARAGRSGTTGVFELGTDGVDGSGPWVLLRTQD